MRLLGQPRCLTTWHDKFYASNSIPKYSYSSLESLESFYPYLAPEIAWRLHNHADFFVRIQEQETASLKLVYLYLGFGRLLSDRFQDIFIFRPFSTYLCFKDLSQNSV